MERIQFWIASVASLVLLASCSSRKPAPIPEGHTRFGPLLKLEVTNDAITIDATALIEHVDTSPDTRADWQEHEDRDTTWRAELSRPYSLELDRGRVRPEDTERSEFLIEPLFAELERRHDVIKQMTRAELLDEQQVSGHLALSVAPDVSYALLTKVLYSSGQAQFSEWSFLADATATSAREVMVVSAPKLCAGIREPDPAAFEWVDCIELRVEVEVEGASIWGKETTRRIDDLGQCTAGWAKVAKLDPPSADVAALLAGLGGDSGAIADVFGGDTSPPAPAPPLAVARSSVSAAIELANAELYPFAQGAWVASRDGVCPTVTSTMSTSAGRGELSEVLQRVSEHGELCAGAVMLTADGATRWSSVWGVMQVLDSSGELRPVFGVRADEAPECAQPTRVYSTKQRR